MARPVLPVRGLSAGPAARRAEPQGRSGALIDDDFKIDWGPDTISQLQKTNRHAANLRTLVFTHQHSDHLTPAELLWAVPPYTNTPPAQPIVVYGNPAVLAALDANVRPTPQANNLDPRLLVPFVPLTTPTGDTLLALPADHGAAGSLVLRITRGRDKKTLFYGHDSGLYPHETLDALQSGPPFDIALFDCTHGGQNIPNRNHMGIGGVIEMAAELKKRGLATPETKLVATHFSHNGGLLHEELMEAFLPTTSWSPLTGWYFMPENLPENLFAHLPARIPLALAPTPLHPMDKLRTLLGGDKSVPRLLIKRDDLNGFALGGNKLRKLEWLLGDAQAQKCNTLITAGAAQSNHCRQTAGAGAAHNMEVHLCLRGPAPPAQTGNLVLDDWLGAVLHFSPPGANVSDALQPLAQKLAAQGKRPYVIPIGGSNAVGTTGYVWAVQEITAQTPSPADHFVVAVGSGGTLAGLHVGVKACHLPTKIIGIGVGEPDTTSWNVDVAHLASQTAAHLRLPFVFAPADIECPMDWMGRHYAAPTPECDAAITLLARTEGIFLDPVYSGKAFAALLDMVKAGRFAPTETVIFWHTGGTPALWARGH